MENLKKQIQAELDNAKRQLDEVEKYEEENGELPQVETSGDLFEAGYFRGLEVALGIIERAGI